MDDNEVNRVIAEYMGLTVRKGIIPIAHDSRTFFEESEEGIDFLFNDKIGAGFPICTVSDAMYCISLDALVPVWEKLKVDNLTYFDGFDTYHREDLPIKFEISIKDNYIPAWKNTLHQAAAHATAIAIKELI